MSKSILGIDLKKFKHVKSDDKSTTLQHKDGHTITIAHSVLSPNTQEMFKALSSSKPLPEPDEHQKEPEFGKVIKKYAEGGETPHYDNYTANAPATVSAPEKSKSPGFKDNTTSAQDTARHASQDAADATYRKSNPTPAEPAEDNSGYTSYAKGGDVLDSDQQGQDVRYANKLKQHGAHCEAKKQMHFAKEEAKGRAEHERHVKPNLKGMTDGGECYACGGKVHNYADGGPTDDSQNSDAQDAVNKAINLTINTGPAAQGQPQQPQGAPNVSSAPPAGIAADPNAQAPQPNAMPDQSQSDASMAPSPQQKPVMPLVQQPMASPAVVMAPQMPTASIPPDVAAQPKEYQDAYAQAKQDHMQKFAQEDVAYQQDLANGHITPQTYQSLFHDKSTLGKIGTLFGVMMGGFSGLNHQANPVLGMMQKQIDNDLQAQEKSKENAQNFLRINQQNLMNQANVKLLNIQQKTEAYALSQAQMLQTSFHDLAKKVTTMPEGSQKEVAKQQLGIIQQQVGAKINNVNDMAAGASAYYNTLFGPGNSNGSGDESAIQKKIQVLKSGALGPQGAEMGHDLESKHIPGIPGLASRPIPEDVRNQLQAQTILDNKVRDVLDFAQKNKGSVNPQVLKTAKQKAEELTSFYNKSVDSLGMTQGRLGWLEEQIKKNPTSLIQQLLGNNATLKEIRDSNVTRRDLALKNLGFPVQSQQQSAGTPQTKTVNGVKYMRGPNGEAIKVK